MITLRHIDRLFSDHKHPRLYRDLITGRPEADCALEPILARTIPLAALAVIRLDELNQSRTPLSRRLTNVVMTSQQDDGGWDNPMTTALCTRALLLAARGLANHASLPPSLNPTARAAGAIAHLARLQHPAGPFPAEPLRRLPPDALTTAYILLQLSDHELFRQTIDFPAAVHWLTTHAPTDPRAARLWSHTTPRCRLHLAPPQRTLWHPSRPAA